MPEFNQMQKECAQLRRKILEIIHGAGSGHCGGSLSSVEILWTLYSRVLRVRPDQPDWPERDRFILSKGHAAPALYTVLAQKGFFDPSLLNTLRRTGSTLQGHPDMRKTPGIEMSTGSLGMGISAGVGMALAGRLSASDYRVFVLVGDGELQEGQNWEAMMSAAKFKLDNLVVIVDCNGVQLDGTTDQIMPMGNLRERIEAFGFEVRECNGHDCRSIHGVFSESGKPLAVIAHTVKGKGISFMEGQNIWHGKPMTPDEYATAQKELEAAL